MSSPPPKPAAGFGATLEERPASRGTVTRADGGAPSSPSGSTLGAALERQVGSLMEQEATLDAAMVRASSGRPMDNRELLRLQATVYAYGQRVEVATRVVDRAAGAVRHLLNIQL